MDRIYGTTISNLENEMRFRLARQGVLASNVSNADTPGYRRFELHLDRDLERAGAAMKSSQAGHLGATPAHAEGYRLERGPRGTRPDGNGVDRDQEVIHMTRNAGAFQDTATVLARIYAMRRMAATGELG